MGRLSFFLGAFELFLRAFELFLSFFFVFVFEETFTHSLVPFASKVSHISSLSVPWIWGLLDLRCFMTWQENRYQIFHSVMCFVEAMCSLLSTVFCCIICAHQVVTLVQTLSTSMLAAVVVRHPVSPWNFSASDHPRLTGS